jgi:tetratricopeptide (TPR) repeat protein
LGFGLTVACSTPAPQVPRAASVSAIVQADVRRAEDAELKRQHDVARAEYERAIADAGDAISRHFAHREFAETLETWGELPAATQHFEAAVAAEPGDALAWQHLGLLYHAAGDDGRARTALEHSKRLAPSSYYPRKALAALDLCANDRAGAIAEYRELLALDLPDRMRTDVTAALAYLAKSPGPYTCGPHAP